MLHSADYFFDPDFDAEWFMISIRAHALPMA